jgi:hypothetical protein
MAHYVFSRRLAASLEQFDSLLDRATADHPFRHLQDLPHRYLTLADGCQHHCFDCQITPPNHMFCLAGLGHLQLLHRTADDDPPFSSYQEVADACIREGNVYQRQPPLDIPLLEPMSLFQRKQRS